MKTIVVGVAFALGLVSPMLALEALKQWRFEAGKKNGEPVLVQIDVMMAFSMEQKQTLWRRVWRRVAG